MSACEKGQHSSRGSRGGIQEDLMTSQVWEVRERKELGLILGLMHSVEMPAIIQAVAGCPVWEGRGLKSW